MPSPGDIVLLETGNLVPADGRLLQSANLRLQEAALYIYPAEQQQRETRIICRIHARKITPDAIHR